MPKRKNKQNIVINYIYIYIIKTAQKKNNKRAAGTRVNCWNLYLVIKQKSVSLYFVIFIIRNRYLT